MNPFYVDQAPASLTLAGRLLRAGWISLRNAALLAAVGVFLLSGSFLPPYLVLPLFGAAIGALGWHLRQARDGKAFLSFVLFCLVLMGMAELRSLADDAGSGVRFAYVIDIDRFLFGTLPTLWLQDRFFEPGRISALDWAAVAVHLTYFPLPFLAGALLARFHPPGFRLLLIALVIALSLSTLYFVAVPTAPPWLAAEEGHLPAVARIGQLAFDDAVSGTYEGGNDVVGVNEVAAFPSVHIATTLLVGLVASRYGRALGIAAALQAALMGIALVYLGEHYVCDLFAGALLALSAYAAALAIESRRLRSSEPGESVPPESAADKLLTR